MSSDSQSPSYAMSGQIQADLKHLGKYQILRKIGAGGMGTVYLAQDTLLNRTVALKVLPKDRAENPTLVRRFQSEARASAMLTHDNIVSVYDADKADGYLYIALEYIDGIDLFEWMRKRQTIPVKRSIDIIKQVTAALQHAHEKKLVHRDIKPANIMITRAGLVKLADMGLARSVDESLDATITRDGTTVGTVDYMSPEQAGNSKNTDIRSDIYSLGCTWYHMLTGSPPFPEGGLTNKLSAHSKTPPPDPRDLNPQVSEAIVAIIHRMMAKKKEDRYQTPAELLEDLNQSTHLESDSGFFLATLLEEDGFDDESQARVAEDELELSSLDFEVQAESQESLARRQVQQPAPLTSPSLPQKQRDKSDNDSGTLPPESSKKRARAQKMTEEDSPSSVPHRPENRTPLKRVRSAQELHDSGQNPSLKSNTSQKSSPPSQTPQPKSAAKFPSKKKETSPVAEKVEASTASNTRRAIEGKPQSQLHVDQDQLKEVKEVKSRQQKGKTKNTAAKKVRPSSGEGQLANDNSGSGIQVDWGRVLLVILVVGLILGGAWWGLDHLRDDGLSPDDNPYGGEVAQQNSAKQGVDGDESNASQDEGDAAEGIASADQEATLRVTQLPLEKVSNPFAPPWWIQTAWDRGTNGEQEQFKVGRGRTGRNLYSTLEAALGELGKRTATIDLSSLTSQQLSPVALKLSGRLVIRASNADPVLVWGGAPAGAGAVPQPWLNVSGGTLELEGLHFMLTNSQHDVVALLHLQGTDLILRNCTFTSLSENPVACVNVSGKSTLKNRIFLENCLFRGERLSGVQVGAVPCDLYCKNTIFGAQEGHLLGFQSPSSQQTQRIHFENCTFLVGTTGLQLEKSSGAGTSQFNNSGIVTAGDTSSGKVEIVFNRSLIVGGGASSTTGIHLTQAVVDPVADLHRAENVTLRLQHTRFVNLKDLTSVKSSDVQRSINDADGWKQFWGVPLPSDDVVSGSLELQHALTQILEHSQTLSANRVDQLLAEIARPGVGERSLVGVNSEAVAIISEAAVERQLDINRWANLSAEQKTWNWSDNTIRFDLSRGKRLNEFLESTECPDGSTVVCFGAGLRRISPITLKNRRLRLRFEETEGTRLTVELEEAQRAETMFVVDGGTLVLEQGTFQFQGVKPDRTTPLFLETRSGAIVQLQHSQVSQPLTPSGSASLISLGPAPSAELPVVVEIKQCLLSGSGPLVSLDAANQSLKMQNSILVSGTDVLSVIATEESELLVIDQCTFRQGGAVVFCRGAMESIVTLVNDSVFGPPAIPSTSATLVRGDSTMSVSGTLTWWESACGHAAQLQTPVSLTEGRVNGSYAVAWGNFWGEHHIYDPLYGPQGVVLEREIENVNRLQPGEFQLQPSSLAAFWGVNGTSLGAKTQTVGPQAQVQPSSIPKASPIKNTPTGF